MLRQRWQTLEEIYAMWGLKFVVAPRCDDPDGVSRASLWEYSKLFRDFLLNQPSGIKLVLVGFSAGAPIMDMGILRSIGFPKVKSEILARFYIEGVHNGLSPEIIGIFSFPATPFVRDMTRGSLFMREAARTRSKKIPIWGEVGGKLSARFPDLFGPLPGSHYELIPGVMHGKLEYNESVHSLLVNLIERSCASDCN